VTGLAGGRGQVGRAHARGGGSPTAGLRKQAPVSVVLIARAVRREDDPVRKPNEYFRSMLRKVERGELYLQKSLFVILKRGGDHLMFERRVSGILHVVTHCVKILLHE
jgi:hypothetical protein